MTGKVTLVGAGPGGKWLLTLRGADAIAQADAVVYDRLVDRDILDLIRPDAARVDVGKENNHHPVPQQEINEILVRLAKEGKNTVRLKGGDCYLFGRGGEECEYLLENGVLFEVIPGVTSALAAPAFAGIPATHRDYCSSVHIITAHARAGKTLEIDFDSLVRLDATLIFLMGLTALEQVMDGLLAAGIDPETPAAVIENGTRGNQRKVVADVSTLSARVRAAGLHSPALILAGRVCALSERLDWWTKLPLHGKTVAVTRPRGRAGTLSEKLRRLGANVIECPVIETAERADVSSLAAALAERWDWVALTSPAGVPAMAHALERAGRDLRALYGCKFAVIGAGTEKELKKFGIDADLCPETFDGAHLAGALAQTVKPGERVLLLRAAAGADALPRILAENGVAFADIATYDTVYRADKAGEMRALLAENALDAVTFTSVSTVEGFVRAIGETDFSGFTALCIGKQTEEAAKRHGMRTVTAKNAAIDDMTACLLEECQNV